MLVLGYSIEAAVGCVSMKGDESHLKATIIGISVIEYTINKPMKVSHKILR